MILPFIFFLFSFDLFSERLSLESLHSISAITLNDDQKLKLEKGELVFWDRYQDISKKKYLREGIAIFRINAKPELVWDIILDFSKYPDWAYKIWGANDYKSNTNNKRYVEFKTQLIGKKYYVEHDLSKLKEGYLTWAIDRDRRSDCVLDTVGFWKIEPVKKHPDQCDIYYSGKVILSRLCAKGFLGIGGFNSRDMAEQTYRKLKEMIP